MKLSTSTIINTSRTDVDGSYYHLNRLEEQQQKTEQEAHVQVVDNQSSSQTKSPSQNKNPIQSKRSIQNKITRENANSNECKLRRRVTKAKLLHRRTLAHYDEQVTAFCRLMTPKLFDTALVVSLIERFVSTTINSFNDCIVEPLLHFMKTTTTVLIDLFVGLRIFSALNLDSVCTAEYSFI